MVGSAFATQLCKSELAHQTPQALAAHHKADLDEIGASGRPVGHRVRKSDQKLKSRTNDSVIVRFAAGTIVLRRGRRERRMRILRSVVIFLAQTNQRAAAQFSTRP
jgi:hypothetical protein